MHAYARSYTVWKFTSPMSGETKTVVRVSEVDDMRYDFAHQRVLWRGMANSPSHALECLAQAGAL